MVRTLEEERCRTREARAYLRRAREKLRTNHKHNGHKSRVEIRAKIEAYTSFLAGRAVVE